MLTGIDVSGWQTPAQVRDHWDKNKFCMIKATEGTGYVSDGLNPLYGVIAEGSDGVIAKDKMYGFYHYARPETGNSPESEAASFLEAVGHHKGYALFALDWEGESLKYSPDWALRWLQHVYQRMDSRPLFYTSASQENTGRYNKIRDAGFPLWVAHWGVIAPTIKHWPAWTMWQYTDKPIDQDRFAGDAGYWRELCGGMEPTEAQPKGQWAITQQADGKIILEKC